MKYHVMAEKAGKKPFEIYTGTENDCREKLIALKIDKATGVIIAGINLKDYNFKIVPA